MNDRDLVAGVLKTLEKIFIDYDKVRGEYPESEFEGLAVLTFAYEVLDLNIDKDRIKRENPEIYNEKIS
jgi:hypothetical protein